MSRLLGPVEFGLFAASLLILRLVSYINQAGIGAALVQRAEVSDEVVRVAFGMSMGLGALLSATTALLAGPLTGLVDSPGSEGLVRLLALTFLFGSASSTGQALLRRAMRFRVLLVVDLTSFVLAACVAVPMALSGAGAYALAGCLVVQSGLTAIMTLLVVRHPVSFLLHPGVMRDLLSFASTVTVISFLEFLASSVPTAAIVRSLGVGSLGQYNRAASVLVPLQQVLAATVRVLASALARVDSRRIGTVYVDAQTLLTTPVLLAAAFIAVESRDIVSMLLGPGWEVAAAALPFLTAVLAVESLVLVAAVMAEARRWLRRKLLIEISHFVAAVAMAGFVAVHHRTLTAFLLAWLVAGTIRFSLYMAVFWRVYWPVRRCLLCSYFFAIVTAVISVSAGVGARAMLSDAAAPLRAAAVGVAMATAAGALSALPSNPFRAKVASLRQKDRLSPKR